MKKIVIFFIIIMVVFFLYLFLGIPEKNEKTQKEIIQPEDTNLNSNIIKDVSYTSKDNDGNEYIIRASQGEIDYSNTSVIYLTDVNAIIRLNNSNNIKITSDYGKYNSNNLDTIFSKNVIIKYLDNKVTGEYLDFSMDRNSMIISKKVVYKNLKNILLADVVEITIDTKDTKIFMFEEKEKVNIKSIN
tara:strand:- start:467 stop:1030 length:564 start_codon:yes stop_codon:yes gene_type:complete